MILIILIILIILVHNSKLRKFVLTKNKDFFYSLSFKRDNQLNLIIKKYIPIGPLKILNFGCGLNTYTDKLTESGYDVTPVDIVDTSIGNSEVYVYDGINIPLHSSGTKYEFAIISTVLHHIPKDKQLNILQSIKNVSNNIIIIEDHVNDGLFGYLIACFSCSVFNLSFFNHPFAFRRKDEWLNLFYNLNPKNIIYDHDIYDLYLLQF